MNRIVAKTFFVLLLSFAGGATYWITTNDNSNGNVLPPKVNSNPDNPEKRNQQYSNWDLSAAKKHLADGRWQEAIALLGRSIRFDPENVEAPKVLYEALRHRRRDIGSVPDFCLTHDQDVTSAAFSPDEKYILTVSRYDVAQLWDAKTGSKLGLKLSQTGGILLASFNSDGSRILTFGKARSALLWSPDSPNQPPIELKSAAGFDFAEFSSDGTKVVTVAPDVTVLDGGAATTQPTHFNAIRVWNSADGMPIGEPLGFFFSYLGIGKPTVSPDDSSVLAVCSDHSARLWAIGTGRQSVPPLQHESVVYCAAYSPDGSLIATASADGTSRVWDASSGKEMFASLKHPSVVTYAEFTPDGRKLITACRDGILRSWDVKSGQELGHTTKSDSSAFRFKIDPTGKRFLSRNGVWEIESMTGQSFEKTPWSTSAPDFSADGSRFFAASKQSASIFDSKTKSQIGAALFHERRLESVALSANGSRVLTSSGKHVYAWSTQTLRPLQSERPEESEKPKNNLPSDIAESFSAVCCGLQIAATGALEHVGPRKRIALWKKISKRLDEFPAWKEEARCTLNGAENSPTWDDPSDGE